MHKFITNLLQDIQLSSYLINISAIIRNEPLSYVLATLVIIIFSAGFALG